MKQPTLFERTLFWRWCYAQKCFEQVISACDFLSKNFTDFNNTVPQLLISGVVVTYYKPFTECKGVGFLSERIVPHRYKNIHQFLKDYRHKVVAHLDAVDFQADDPSFGNINQVQLDRTTDDYDLFVLIHAGLPIADVKNLATTLEHKAIDEMDKFANRYIMVPSLQPGLYKLGIHPREPAFVPRSPD